MYKKIYSGATFGPGAQFPDHRCLFENCTFLASCTFGDHCDFVNCTFQKCCPKPNNNISKTGEHCRFFDCKLESINVGPWAELHNTNRSGYLVTVTSTISNKSIAERRGGEETISTQICGKCGQRINSKEVKKGKDFYDYRCDESLKPDGYSDVEVTLEWCKCHKMR